MKKEGLMIYIGADHAGFELKEKIKGFLDSKKIRYLDLGTIGLDRADYPDFAFKVGEKVASEHNALGVLICGSGIGMCIAANKVAGVRAAAVYDDYTAKMSREHNNANVICLRGRNFSDKENLRLLDIWLKEEFSKEERHLKRLGKIEKYEKSDRLR